MSKSIINVMLVGKTGSGKSLLANNLLGLGENQSFFNVAECGDGSRGKARCTTNPKSRCGTTNGVTMRVIDTPGFFDTENTVNERWLDILKAVNLAGASLDVIVLVLSTFQIGSGIECFKIVKNYMTEYLVDRLIIVFTHCGKIDADKQQRCKVKFNEGVGTGTLGASYVLSDQKTDKRLDEILDMIKDIKQRDPTRLRKRNFKAHTEKVLKLGLKSMTHTGDVTYQMYCEEMRIDPRLLRQFIPESIDAILEQHNRASIVEQPHEPQRDGDDQPCLWLILVIIGVCVVLVAIVMGNVAS